MNGPKGKGRDAFAASGATLEAHDETEAVGSSPDTASTSGDKALDSSDPSIPAGGAPVGVRNSKGFKLQAASFSGPLPPPELFRGYNEACPGAGDRILAMAEEEGRHRRELEKMAMTAGIADGRRGQYSGLILVGIFTVAGTVMALAGVPTAGIAIVIGALTTAAGAAVWSKYTEWKQMKDERDAERRRLEAAEARRKAVEGRTRHDDKLALPDGSGTPKKKKRN